MQPRRFYLSSVVFYSYRISRVLQQHSAFLSSVVLPSFFGPCCGENGTCFSRLSRVAQQRDDAFSAVCAESYVTTGVKSNHSESSTSPIQVPCSTDSLNTGDVFILDAGLKLYLWSGADANMYEKSKGVQTMQRIKVISSCRVYVYTCRLPLVVRCPILSCSTPATSKLFMCVSPLWFGLFGLIGLFGLVLLSAAFFFFFFAVSCRRVVSCSTWVSTWVS